MQRVHFHPNTYTHLSASSYAFETIECKIYANSFPQGSYATSLLLSHHGLKECFDGKKSWKFLFRIHVTFSMWKEFILWLFLAQDLREWVGSRNGHTRKHSMVSVCVCVWLKWEVLLGNTSWQKEYFRQTPDGQLTGFQQWTFDCSVDMYQQSKGSETSTRVLMVQFRGRLQFHRPKQLWGTAEGHSVKPWMRWSEHSVVLIELCSRTNGFVHGLDSKQSCCLHWLFEYQTHGVLFFYYSLPSLSIAISTWLCFFSENPLLLFGTFSAC